MPLHLVRLGAFARVGPFRSLDATRYPRGRRVIVETARGLEIGEVVAPPRRTAADEIALGGMVSEGDLGSDGFASMGAILRAMTVEDELLEARLTKNRDAAFLACQRRLAELGLEATLLDVEHLFDGRSLFFYFLGDVPPQVDALTSQLASLYDAQVQFHKFAETLHEGCGPDCGTTAAAGGGCGSCASGCSLASACGK